MEIPPGRVCFPPRLFLPGSASAREADSEVIYLAGYRRSFQVALPNDVPVPQFVPGDVVSDCGQRKQRKDSRWLFVKSAPYPIAHEAANNNAISVANARGANRRRIPVMNRACPLTWRD